VSCPCRPCLRFVHWLRCASLADERVQGPDICPTFFGHDTNAGRPTRVMREGRRGRAVPAAWTGLAMQRIAGDRIGPKSHHGGGFR
jgi:hypothetical protein